MKMTKILFAAIAAISASMFVAKAQQADVYTIVGTPGVPSLTENVFRLPALTTNVVAKGVSSTNVYGLPSNGTNLLILPVNEFDYVGFTWAYGAGSNATVQVYRSYDNGYVFENNPGYSFSGPATSSAAFSTNAMLDVRGASQIAFVLKNASTLDLTNDLIEVNLKSPKYGAKAATR